MIKSNHVIGVDIGGTNTKIGLVSAGGKIELQRNFRTDKYKGGPDYAENLAREIKDICAAVGDAAGCRGVGIAAPNVNFLKGTIESPANLKWGTFDLVGELKKYIDRPVKIVNDANAAALGELRYGLAKNLNTFVVITLGTGLGSGIVINGELLNGSNGLAGELGHLTVEPQGRLCGCGRLGCLETYMSANGLRRSVLYFLSQRPYDSELAHISYSELSAKAIAEAAAQKDALALDVLDFTVRILARKLADVVVCLDPQAFIFMGGVANMGEQLFAPLRTYFEESLMPVFRGKIRIIHSKMKDGEAAILGASTLVA